MATTRDTLDHSTLARLVEASAVRGATVIGQPGGWGVVIQYGMTERALAAKRGTVRIWKKFETLVSYLKDLGLVRYQVDAVNYTPDALKASTTKRPDAAERMKRAHEAAAYDEWFRQQVQEAIDDPRPSIPHEQVRAEWQTERAALLKQAEQAGN